MSNFDTFEQNHEIFNNEHQLDNNINIDEEEQNENEDYPQFEQEIERNYLGDSLNHSNNIRETNRENLLSEENENDEQEEEQESLNKGNKEKEEEFISSNNIQEDKDIGEFYFQTNKKWKQGIASINQLSDLDDNFYNLDETERSKITNTNNNSHRPSNSNNNSYRPNNSNNNGLNSNIDSTNFKKNDTKNFIYASFGADNLNNIDLNTGNNNNGNNKINNLLIKLTKKNSKDKLSLFQEDNKYNNNYNYCKDNYFDNNILDEEDSFDSFVERKVNELSKFKNKSDPLTRLRKLKINTIISSSNENEKQNSSSNKTFLRDNAEFVYPRAKREQKSISEIIIETPSVIDFNAFRSSNKEIISKIKDFYYLISTNEKGGIIQMNNNNFEKEGSSVKNINIPKQSKHSNKYHPYKTIIEKEMLNLFDPSKKSLSSPHLNNFSIDNTLQSNNNTPSNNGSGIYNTNSFDFVKKRNCYQPNTEKLNRFFKEYI